MCIFSVKNDRSVDIRNRPRIPVPDEDPYSVAGNKMVTFFMVNHELYEIKLDNFLTISINNVLCTALYCVIIVGNE